MNKQKSIFIFFFTLLLWGCEKSDRNAGNDPAVIGIGDVRLPEGLVADTTLDFAVTLSHPVDAPVSVHYVTREGTAKSNEHFVPVGSQVITFQPGETQKKVPVRIRGDHQYANESFSVKLFNPVNGIIDKDAGTATVRNDVIAASVVYKLSGLCFSPYMDGQSPDLHTPISEQQIIGLLNKVKDYTLRIRTFGCTEGLEKIAPNAKKLGLQVAQGAWLGKDLNDNQKQIANLIALGKAGSISVAIVGSEVLLRKDLTKDQLIGYIRQVKTALPNIPVTTGELYQNYIAYPDLVSAVDVLFVHMYPYWEGIPLKCATNFINYTYDRVRAKSQGKQVVVAETGWPSGGNTIGNAVPSPANAAEFFLNFVSWASAKSVRYYYFEYMDETWKQAKEGPQGAHWGLFYKNGGSLKPGMIKVFNGETKPNNWIVSYPTGTPPISFTYVPTKGSTGNLKGIVRGFDPNKYRVAVFIYVNCWYTKPTFAAPLTRIECDGSFECDITTGGNDAYATRIRAYVVPATYTPPPVNCSATIPSTIEQNKVAWTEAIR